MDSSCQVWSENVLKVCPKNGRNERWKPGFGRGDSLQDLLTLPEHTKDQWFHPQGSLLLKSWFPQDLGSQCFDFLSHYMWMQHRLYPGTSAWGSGVEGENWEQESLAKPNIILLFVVPFPIRWSDGWLVTQICGSLLHFLGEKCKGFAHGNHGWDYLHFF